MPRINYRKKCTQYYKQYFKRLNQKVPIEVCIQLPKCICIYGILEFGNWPVYIVVIY